MGWKWATLAQLRKVYQRASGKTGVNGPEDSSAQALVMVVAEGRCAGLHVGYRGSGGIFPLTFPQPRLLQGQITGLSGVKKPDSNCSISGLTVSSDYLEKKLEFGYREILNVYIFPKLWNLLPLQ